MDMCDGLSVDQVSAGQYPYTKRFDCATERGATFFSGFALDCALSDVFGVP